MLSEGFVGSFFLGPSLDVINSREIINSSVIGKTNIICTSEACVKWRCSS